MKIELTGKKALVTGGTRGIGRAITSMLAESGAEVFATYLSSSAASEDFVGALVSKGYRVHAIKMDVRDSQSVDLVIDEIEKSHGSIDILVNNAGIVKDGLTMTMEDSDWRDVINTNLDGAFRTIRRVSRSMMRQRRGVIINMSSVAASRPGRGQANYAASKGAIEAMTKALAVELSAKNIRVNAVAPGVIETEMSQEVRDAAGDEILKSVLLKRFGKVEDIAAAVVYLCSDYASYVTGEVLHVDGGIKL